MAGNTDFVLTDLMLEAAEKGDLYVIEELAKIQENINPSTHNGNTVLHVAAEKGHLNVVSFYTNQLSNPNPCQLSNDKFRGRTPLHYAAREGHLPVVQHLVNLLDDKNPQDEPGTTPLHCASLNGHLEIIKFLLPSLSDKNPKAGAQ